MHGRYALIVALMITAVSTLTACESTGTPAPIAFRANGSGIEIGICADVTAERAVGEVRDSPGGSRRPFWEATGDIRLSSGETLLASGASSRLLTKFYARPPTDPGSVLSVSLIAPGKSGDDAYGEVQVPDTGLPSTEWLRSDGAAYRRPCA